MSPTEHDGHDPDAAPTTGATAVEGTGAHRHGRRYWGPAAAVAAAVVVIGGSVLVLGTRAAPTPVTAAAGNTAPTSSQANPITAAPTTVAGALSGKVMLQRFVDLVPRPGTLTHFVDLSHGGAPGPAQVVFNDGHGAAEIIVGMQTATTGRPAGPLSQRRRGRHHRSPRASVERARAPTAGIAVHHIARRHPAARHPRPRVPQRAHPKRHEMVSRCPAPGHHRGLDP